MQASVYIDSAGGPMPTDVLPLSTRRIRSPLADGRRFTVRPITPASKPLIAAAMTRLSPESIRRRFFAPRRELSDSDLHRLTAMDGWNQYALGACTRGADGALEGIARRALCADLAGLDAPQKWRSPLSMPSRAEASARRWWQDSSTRPPRAASARCTRSSCRTTCRSSRSCSATHRGRAGGATATT